MVSIERLLQRRSDLSSFLVHLTRGADMAEARGNLLSMAREWVIEARTAMGMADELQEYLEEHATQKVVCFTETPLEHMWMMTENIDSRQKHFAPYGLVFTRTSARRTSCNPVWYIDMTYRVGVDWLTKPVNNMVAAAVADSKDADGRIIPERLADHDIFRVTPFFEQMGPTKDAMKEFWWEREWRHVGDYHFEPRHVVAFVAPEEDHDALRAELIEMDDKYAKRPHALLDPAWGLERTIATLSGVPIEDTMPFPGR
jgi:hypothetical protein